MISLAKIKSVKAFVVAFSKYCTLYSVCINVWGTLQKGYSGNISFIGQIYKNAKTRFSFSKSDSIQSSSSRETLNDKGWNVALMNLLPALILLFYMFHQIMLIPPNRFSLPMPYANRILQGVQEYTFNLFFFFTWKAEEFWNLHFG